MQEVESHCRRLRERVSWKRPGGLNAYFNKQASSIVEIEKGGKQEPTSGMNFPGKVCLVGDKSSCVELAGVGVRKKRLAGIKDIKAYAVGVYFHPNDVRKTASQRAVLAKSDGEGGKEPVEKLLDGVREKGKNII